MDEPRITRSIRDVPKREPAKHRQRWGIGRIVTRKVFTYRFEIRAEGVGPAMVFNAHTATEALRFARLYADTGSRVYVRDRSRRRGYLTEDELSYMAHEETNNDQLV